MSCNGKRRRGRIDVNGLRRVQLSGPAPFQTRGIFSLHICAGVLGQESLEPLPVCAGHQDRSSRRCASVRDSALIAPELIRRHGSAALHALQMLLPLHPIRREILLARQGVEQGAGYLYVCPRIRQPTKSGDPSSWSAWGR